MLASFGVKVDTAPLDHAKGKLDGIGKAVGGLTGLFGGLAAAAGLGAFKSQIDDLAKESGELRAASLKAGVGFEEFQKTSYVTGLSTEQLTTLFRKMQQNVAQASGKVGDAAGAFDDLDGGLGRIVGGGKAATEAFKKLGISLQGKSNAEIFQETAQAIAKIQNPAEKTALAMKLFGRSGQDLIPFLSKSPESIAEAAEQFDTFGGISEDSAARLKEYSKANKSFNLALRSLKIAILTEIVPAFTWLIQKGNDIAKWFKQNVDTSSLLVAALGVLGAVFVTLGGSALASAAAAAGAWLLAAAPIAFLILLVDDLIHFFKGDAKTATEDLIKALFGDKGESFIAQIRKDAKELVEELRSVEGIVDKIKKILDIIGTGARVKFNQLIGAPNAEDVQVASLGITRKARQREKRAITEETLGVSLPQAFGGVQASVEPSASFAPAAPAARKPAQQTNTVTQSMNVTQNIYGSDAQDAADQAKEGIKDLQGDERRATAAMLEAQKFLAP